MTLAELVPDLERRATEAEAMHATAPVAAVLRGEHGEWEARPGEHGLTP